MGFHRGPKIVTDGLVFCLDYANTKSYVSGSGTSVADVLGNVPNLTLQSYPSTGDSFDNLGTSIAYNSNVVVFNLVSWSYPIDVIGLRNTNGYFIS